MITEVFVGTASTNFIQFKEVLTHNGFDTNVMKGRAFHISVMMHGKPQRAATIPACPLMSTTDELWVHLHDTCAQIINNLEDGWCVFGAMYVDGELFLHLCTIKQLPGVLANIAADRAA